MKKIDDVSYCEYPAHSINRSDFIEIEIRRRHRFEMFQQTFECDPVKENILEGICLRLILKFYLLLKKHSGIKYYLRRIIELSPKYVKRKVFHLVHRALSFKNGDKS